MKLLMLGYAPYMAEIISALKGSDFLVNHQIDVIFPRVTLNAPPHLFDVAKQDLTADEFKNFMADFARYYENDKLNDILNQAFVDTDISFLKEYPNIRLKAYPGLEQIENLSEYDHMIVASFGEKIPRKIFTAPVYGSINIHPSFLPDLRGGYPNYIQAFEPTQICGTTIHVISDDWDEGDILIQRQYETESCLTSSELLSLSAEQAAQLLEKLFRLPSVPVKQEPARVTQCKKILEKRYYVKQMISSKEFEGFVRANNDRYLFPYTYAFLAGELFMILEVKTTVTNPGQMNKWPEREILEIEGRYYIRFGLQVYLISRYIFRGKFVLLSFFS